MGKIEALGSKLALRLLSSRLSGQWHAAGGELVVDRGWIRLIFSNDGDMQELYYHAHCQAYYEHDMAVFRRLVRSNGVVLDVGANLGFVSVMLAGLVGNAGTVFSFEPSPRVFSKLLKTVGANGLERTVIPLNVGLGRQAEITYLNRINHSSGNSSIVNGSHALDREEIHVVPLDSVDQVNAKRIDFIKIDTEGYEPDVLLGAKQLIERDRPVIYLEMGGEYLPSTERSIEILRRYGYEIDLPQNVDWKHVGNGANFVATYTGRVPAFA